MRIHVLQLLVGDRLISDSFNPFGLHVLASGTLLDAEGIEKLNRHDIEYVDIIPRMIEQTEHNDSASFSSSVLQAIAFSDAVEGIKDLFRSAELEGLIHDEEVSASFNPLIDSFQQQKDVVHLLLSLNNKDDYTYQHSVQVGMLSYYIAKWMGMSEEEATIVGKAGYLHDIGKSKIDSDILKKPDHLTAAEFNEIKKHTIYGYNILQQSFQDTPLSLVALQHHERLDGNGYPMGKKGVEIHPYAKIVAIADVYSAMISKRVYQEEKDLLFVLKELYKMSFGELDPQVTQVFIKHMIPNFIGKRVILSNGKSGSIVLTNPSDFFRPLVQVEDQFIDLSQESRIEIISIAT